MTTTHALSLANFDEEYKKSVKGSSEEASGISHFVTSQFDPSLSWSDLAWLRSITRLPVLVKGIMAPEDALLAAQHGASGVIVSNHGGRQLDGCLAAVEALRPVVAALAGRLPVFMDGGVRRGTDVLKALALGAQMVFVGRPMLWGLAHDGQRGAQLALTLLRDELRLAMGLCGESVPARWKGGRNRGSGGRDLALARIGSGRKPMERKAGDNGRYRARSGNLEQHVGTLHGQSAD